MRKKNKFILCIILLLIVIKPALSQEGWFWQNPGPTANHMNCVIFVDDTTGWAVGDAGTLITTKDGGITWENQLIPFTYYSSLNGVDFISNTTGWVVGRLGTILKTTNGGNIWFIQQINKPYHLYDVDFISETIGIAVGGDHSQTPGIILNTIDGGETWTAQPNVSKLFYSVNFTSDSIAYAVGEDGEIWKTTSGGSEWFELLSPTTVDLISVSFINDATGWIVGETTILHTTDGGISWVDQSTELIPYFRSVHFVSNSIGWIATLYGSVWKSTDGGYNWSSMRPVSQQLNSIYFSSDSFGWVVGNNGSILRTTDGGNNWISSSNGIDFRLWDVKFTSESNGSIVGADYIMHSTDGGDSWTIRYDVPGNTIQLQSLFFISDSIGWATGGQHGIVVKTTDGGLTWDPHSNASGNTSSIFFISDSLGWVVGDSEYIEKTTDGGETWTIQLGGFYNFYHLNSVCFTSELNGYAAGEGGRLYYTTNGGDNWGVRIFSTIQALRSIYFISHSTGWMSGSQGVILKTTNSGNTWFQQTTGISNEWIYSIHFSSENLGWAVGNGGTILKTTDGGDNWTQIPKFTNGDLQSVFFISEDTGWITGGYGIILKTTNGGVTFIEEDEIDETPTEFLLSQNYPNPFNPYTKIKYSVPQLSNVVIKVFDILGNEIETLVSEEKQTGTYEITWYAEQLPSGIYFYKLQAGSFIETKKMVLLK
jgi:photosystem II stability/assembly factor-like uncharacterized protein